MSELYAAARGTEPHEASDETRTTDTYPVQATEDVLVRNHDFQHGYDVAVTATDVDGRTVHDARCYLQPGKVESIFGVFDPGDYEVRAVLDGRRAVSASVRIDGPSDGVLVEVGNGAVSLHAGLYG